MSPQARRRIIPILVLLAAAGILLAVIFGPKRQPQLLTNFETLLPLSICDPSQVTCNAQSLFFIYT